MQAIIFLSITDGYVWHLCDISAILGKEYSDVQNNIVTEISKKVKIKIIEISNQIKVLEVDQVYSRQKESQKEYDLKLISIDQSAKEIKLRCNALCGRFTVTPAEMSDSQLLVFSKGLHSLETEASNILDKVTTYTKCVTEVGVLDRLSEMDNLVEDTLDQKEKYVEAVRKEVADRDLSE